MIWLRIWVLFTGLAGISAAIGAFVRPLSPIETLYRNISPKMSLPVARLYATWLLLSSVVRLTFVVSSYHTSLAIITFATYLIALIHFSMEIFIYQTVPLYPGGQAPLLVATVSASWLAYTIFVHATEKRKQR
eukprot:jgi/Galph1/5238/GphlegSOOS_G3852.1